MRTALKTQRLYELEAVTDSLLIGFDSEPQVDYVMRYVHKHWNHNSCPNENALVAITDEVGFFSIVSCLETKHNEFHNHFSVIIGSDTIRTIGYNIREYYGSMRVTDTLPPDGIGESILFGEERTLDIGKAISERSDETIRVDVYYNADVIETYTLSRENKEAIAETYRLHLVLQEMRLLRSELYSSF